MLIAWWSMSVNRWHQVLYTDIYRRDIHATYICISLSISSFHLKEFGLNLVLVDSMSRDSVVGIATGYGLDNRGVGVRVPVGSRIFSAPRRPWSPLNLLSNGCRGSFPRGESGRDVKLATHSQVVSRQENVDLYSHSPILLHGVVVN
jgi:hypothetical protein